MIKKKGLFLSIFLLIYFIFFPNILFASINIPILCYHNLNPTIPGSMNITPQKFESQIKWIRDNGFTIIPLKKAVDYLAGRITSLPPKSVVITVDDGWKSVYTYMFPIIKKYQIPVTLFIYPEPISHGKNNLTWDQLKELKNTGLFDIESHTYWHPNFKQERRKLSISAYHQFVEKQLKQSKLILENKLDIKVTLLAWPFGIYDPFLEDAASKAGYEMAFSIDDKTANKQYRPMSQPRFMIIEGRTMKTFMSILNKAK